MKKYGKWIICVLCFLTFSLIATKLLSAGEFIIDNSVYDFVSKFKCGFVTVFFRIITLFASPEFIIMLLLLLLFILNRNNWFKIFINSVNVLLINQLLKIVFLRGRPIGIALIKEDGYSFPSGHAMMATAFYGFIIYMIYKSKISKNKKILLISLLSLLIILIGLSRIYLGVHFATDVIAGIMLSISYLVIYTELLERFIKKDEK